MGTTEQRSRVLVQLDLSEERRRQLAVVGVLLLLAAALRLVILFTGQRYLRSDEAVVGLMAKHIFTRSERPLFLYGQSYGGGHAIVAYIAAPLLALFGRSAILLTSVPMTVSLVNIYLVWAILKRYKGVFIAAGGAAAYAFSPPVIYQAFLVNGGTETFCLCLVALMVFLRIYFDGRITAKNGFLVGLLSGLAFWGMDYALLYPIVFVSLLLEARQRGVWKCLAAMACGFIVGTAPLTLYNLSHDFAHLRHLFRPPGAVPVPLGRHVGGALLGLLRGDLAAFYGGDIDDFKAPGMGAWIHAIIAVISGAALLFSHRRFVMRRLRNLFSKSILREPFPFALVPIVFLLAYICMYSLAGFSLQSLRTPRYLLPLCPFLSIAIVLAAARIGRGGKKVVVILVSALVLRGAALSLEIGMRPWHEELCIRTSGPDVSIVAQVLADRNIRYVFASYEVQWRLMFETDERVVASCEGVSALQRYPLYEAEVQNAVEKEGAPWTFVFRKDFAFEQWAAARRYGIFSAAAWARTMRWAERRGGPFEVVPAGEFNVFIGSLSDL